MQKRLKKIGISFILLLGFMLVSCVMDPESFYYNYDELKEDVVAVELINYDSEAVRIKSREEILPFNFHKMEVIETLELDQLEGFFLELSKIHFHKPDRLTRYYNTASGLSIRMIYSSGNFVVMCCNKKTNFVTMFDSDGNLGEYTIKFTGISNFTDLVNNNFITKIED